MSNKTKTFIMAVITLIGTLFGAYIALTDDDDSTTANIEQISDDGKNAYDKYKDLKSDDATTIEKVTE
jgi:hypothetical protein